MSKLETDFQKVTAIHGRFWRLTPHFLWGLALCGVALEANLGHAQSKYAAETLPLSAPGGRTYLKKAKATDFWRLISFYRDQPTGASCSATSLSMVLNALISQGTLTTETRYWKPIELTEKISLHNWNARTFSKLGSLGKFGVSLAPFAEIISAALKEYAPGHRAEALPAEDLTLAKLRTILSENEKSESDFLIANFEQKVFTADQNAGHIAPIGAFDSKTDRVLILDPDRDWYEPYWVSTSKLLEALKTQDSESGKLRGLIWIRK